jgi:hypothetical protein
MLQLRVETYNTFNHPQFNGVNDTATFQSANQLTTNPQTASNFGTMNSAQNPRYMQFGSALQFLKRLAKRLILCRRYVGVCRTGYYDVLAALRATPHIVSKPVGHT